jgi:hypothetical protein
MNTDQRDAGFGRDLRQIKMVVELLALSGQEAVAELAPLLHPEMRVLAAPGVAPVRS